MDELKIALADWQKEAESEARANTVELAKVVEALREKIVDSIEEVKSNEGAD